VRAPGSRRVIDDAVIASWINLVDAIGLEIGDALLFPKQPDKVSVRERGDVLGLQDMKERLTVDLLGHPLVRPPSQG
jgi:hypothetical protein